MLKQHSQKTKEIQLHFLLLFLSLTWETGNNKETSYQPVHQHGMDSSIKELSSLRIHIFAGFMLL